MDTTMSTIRSNRLEVVTSVQRRRRWTSEQKIEIVKQTNESGSSVSFVARQHGLTAAHVNADRNFLTLAGRIFPHHWEIWAVSPALKTGTPF